MKNPLRATWVENVINKWLLGAKKNPTKPQEVLSAKNPFREKNLF